MEACVISRFLFAKTRGSQWGTPGDGGFPLRKMTSHHILHFLDDVALRSFFALALHLASAPTVLHSPPHCPSPVPFRHTLCSREMASTMTRAALAPPAVASARRGTKARTTAASGAGGKSQKAVRWTLSRAGSTRGATASSSASSWPVSDASTAAAGATRATRAVRRGASLVPAAVAEPPAAPAASSDSSEGKETFNWHLQWYVDPVPWTLDPEPLTPKP